MKLCLVMINWQRCFVLLNERRNCLLLSRVILDRIGSPLCLNFTIINWG